MAILLLVIITILLLIYGHLWTFDNDGQGRYIAVKSWKIDGNRIFLQRVKGRPTFLRLPHDPVILLSGPHVHIADYRITLPYKDAELFFEELCNHLDPPDEIITAQNTQTHQ